MKMQGTADDQGKSLEKLRNEYHIHYKNRLTKKSKIVVDSSINFAKLSNLNVKKD